MMSLLHGNSWKPPPASQFILPFSPRLVFYLPREIETDFELKPPMPTDQHRSKICFLIRVHPRHLRLK